MQNNPFFDDLSRMMSGAAGTMMDMRKELEQTIFQQVKAVAGRMDLVSRDEFEVVKAMAEKARAENEALKARLDALEAKKPAKTAPKKPSK